VCLRYFENFAVFDAFYEFVFYDIAGARTKKYLVNGIISVKVEFKSNRENMNILSQSFIAGQSLSLSYNSNHARSTMCDEYAPICTRFFNQPFFLEFFQVGSCHLNKTGAGFAKCPSVSLSHACQCSDGNAEH